MKLSKYKFIALGIGLGVLAGYAYYYFIGCANGTCAITSNPINSSLYGAFMGGLVGDMFGQNKKNKKAEE